MPVTLVSTASFLLLDEEGLPLEEPRMLGTNEMEVFTVHSDWPADRILSTMRTTTATRRT